MQESPIAVFEVGGSNFSDLKIEAYSDAEAFMGPYTDWSVSVVNCIPMEIDNGRVLTWKGHAVIKWDTSE